MRKIVAAILAFAMILTLATALFPGLSSEASAQLDKSQSATNLIVVKQGETFEIAIQQPLHPAYDWLCDNFDEEYVALAGVEYEPPAGGAIGVTNKVFSFEALKAGTTTIEFGYYELDTSGNPLNLLESETYTVKIEEPVHIPGVVGPISVEIEPAQPEAGSDISVIVSGEFGAANYAVIRHHHLVIGKTVLIWGFVSQTASVGAQVITPWEFTDDIGKLCPGEYIVKVFLNWQKVASTQFTVSVPGVVGSITVEIEPAQPEAGSDISVIVSGEFGAANYAVIRHHQLVIGKTVLIWGFVSQTAPVGAQVITPWEFTEDIGKLCPGEYTVKVFLNWQKVAGTQFTVSSLCVTTDKPAYKAGETVTISINNTGYRPIRDSLTLSICDEEGNVFASVVFLLGWAPLLPGESITMDWSTNIPGEYTVIVKGAGGGSAEFTVVEPVDIGDIWQDPSEYVGQYVLIDSKYTGWSGDCEYGAPLTYSDWMLEDETGCIYVSAWSEGQPNLSPPEEEDLDTPLEVIALVTTTLDDEYSWNDNMPFQPYLESQRVWGVQTITDKSQYELGEPVTIAITNIGSDTLSGGGVCMSIYDTEGNLVSGGICMFLAFEWEPGEGIVWHIPWDQTDVNGEQVPAGTYIIECQADRFADTAEIYISD